MSVSSDTMCYVDQLGEGHTFEGQEHPGGGVCCVEVLLVILILKNVYTKSKSACDMDGQSLIAREKVQRLTEGIHSL